MLSPEGVAYCVELTCEHLSFSVYNKLQLDTIKNEKRIFLYKKIAFD